MTATTTTSLTAEYEARDRKFYDRALNIELIDLNSYLTDSFNEYILYIAENELKLTRKEKNKLGMHFIIKHLINILKSSKHKKCFYYKIEDKRSEEAKLIKRLFSSLPARIQYGELPFLRYVQEEHPYNVYKSRDNSTISFHKFRSFLKRYELQQHEKEFFKRYKYKTLAASINIYMNKFLARIDEELGALGDEIPSQEFKLALKDLLNSVDGWVAVPMNTTSESTTDRLRVKWQGKVFAVNIEEIHAEDEDGISAQSVVDDAGEQYDSEENLAKKLKNQQGKEASRVSKEYKKTVLDDAIRQIKDEIANYGKNK